MDAITRVSERIVMSKNIEEIVDSVIPKPCLDWNKTSIAERVFCRDSLKQAITEGKLCVPLSEEEILKHFERYQEQHEEMNENSKLRAKCAKELYEAQFGGNK